MRLGIPINWTIPLALTLNRRKDIAITHNFRNGMCLIADFFQEVNAHRGEIELRATIVCCMDVMADYLGVMGAVTEE